MGLDAFIYERRHIDWKNVINFEHDVLDYEFIWIFDPKCNYEIYESTFLLCRSYGSPNNTQGSSWTLMKKRNILIERENQLPSRINLKENKMKTTINLKKSGFHR